MHCNTSSLLPCCDAFSYIFTASVLCCFAVCFHCFSSEKSSHAFSCLCVAMPCHMTSLHLCLVFTSSVMWCPAVLLHCLSAVMPCSTPSLPLCHVVWCPHLLCCVACILHCSVIWKCSRKNLKHSICGEVSASKWKTLKSKIENWDRAIQFSWFWHCRLSWTKKIKFCNHKAESVPVYTFRNMIFCCQNM